jgi:hypothetical protein
MDQPGLKAHRDNKVLSDHKVRPDQEVKLGHQALRARLVLKVLKAKVEHKDPQVHQASEARQEYRDPRAPLEQLGLLVRPALRVLSPRRKFRCAWSPGQNR